MNESPYSLQEVLELNHFFYQKGRDRIQIPCPFCKKSQKFKKNMNIVLSSENFHCSICNTCGQGGTLFHALLHEINTKEAYQDISRELGRQKMGKAMSAICAEHSSTASIEARDKTYRRMLQLLRNLKEPQKHYLFEKGLRVEEIDALHYGSVPFQQDALTELPGVLLKNGYQLQGIPGFFLNQDGKWQMNFSDSGMLIPSYDIQKRMQDLLIRLDYPIIDAKTGTWIQRYLPFTSVGKQQGCMPQDSVHYACEWKRNTETNQFVPDIPYYEKWGLRVLFFVIGPLRADIFHQISGFPCIAVKSMQSLFCFEKELQGDLKKYADCIVCACGKNDIKTLSDQQHFNQLKAAVEENGYCWKQHTWDCCFQEKELKNLPREYRGLELLRGIDDLYAFRLRGTIPVLESL